MFILCSIASISLNDFLIHTSCSQVFSIAVELWLRQAAAKVKTMAFVYINGYPAVGKLTVAKELTQVYPRSLPTIVSD